MAIGWTVLLGAARLVNFAHGQLYMLGAFVAWAAMDRAGLSYWASIPVAVVAVVASQYPVIAVTGAALLLRERLRTRQWIGVALVLASVAVLSA